MADKVILEQINDILKDSPHNKTLQELFISRREELGLSIKQVSNVLSIDYSTLKNIIEKKTQKIDYLNVLKLSRFLEIDKEEFGKLFLHDATNLVGELSTVNRYTFLVNRFDLKALKRAGFIDSITDLEAIENRINQFFGFDNIYEYNEPFGGVLFSSSRLTPSERMKEFWVKSAYTMFEKIDNPNPYDRELLKELVPKIRPYTQNVDNGLVTVSQALFNAGVTVIFQPYLTNTAVRGGTFCVDGKPCIVVTDYNKYYPTIWFALLHEIHHALFDLEDINKYTYHLTGESQPDMFLLDEQKANEFARDFLFSEEKSKYIRPMINNHHIVSRYAKKHEIHPSIIYAFYQFDKDSDGHNFWGFYRQYFPDVKRAVGKLNLVPWEKQSIDDSVEDLKETITQFK